MMSLLQGLAQSLVLLPEFKHRTHAFRTYTWLVMKSMGPRTVKQIFMSPAKRAANILFSVGAVCPFICTSTLKVVDGFQPYNTCVMFWGPRYALFGVNVLWPTFGVDPLTKITYRFILAFPEPFSKTTGWFTTKLDSNDLQANCTFDAGQNCFMLTLLLPVLFKNNTGWITNNLDAGHPQGSKCFFWGNYTLIHFCCSMIRQNNFYVCVFVPLINFKFSTLLDHRCSFREICLLCDLYPLLETLFTISTLFHFSLCFIFIYSSQPSKSYWTLVLVNKLNSAGSKLRVVLQVLNRVVLYESSITLSNKMVLT